MDERIQLNNDTLITDADLCREWRVCSKTLARYEKHGLPVIYVGGRKYRPQSACREWLATQNGVRRRLK